MQNIIKDLDNAYRIIAADEELSGKELVDQINELEQLIEDSKNQLETKRENLVNMIEQFKQDAAYITIDDMMTQIESEL